MLGYDEGIKLGLSGVKVIGTILGNVDIIAPGFVIGTDMGYLDESFDGYDYGKLEVLLIGYSLVYTNCKLLVSD